MKRNKKFALSAFAGIALIIALIGYGQVSFILKQQEAEEKIYSFIANYPNPEALLHYGFSYDEAEVEMNLDLEIKEIEIIDEAIGWWTYRLINMNDERFKIDLAQVSEEEKWHVSSLKKENT